MEAVLQSADALDADSRTSIGKALDLLRAFGDDAHDGLGVSELARRAQLSKSTAHRILGSMESGGAIARVGKLYRRGALFTQMQASPRRMQHDWIRELLTPHIAELYASTGFTTHLAVLDGSDVVYLNKLQDTRSSRSPVRIGGRAPAYSTAVGKAMLAFNAPALRRLQDVEFVKWTPATVSNQRELSQELSRIRLEGHAIDRGETVSTIRCVAAPVPGLDGKAVAAISLSWDAGVAGTENLAQSVHKAARAASRALTVAHLDQMQSRKAAAMATR